MLHDKLAEKKKDLTYISLPINSTSNDDILA